MSRTIPGVGRLLVCAAAVALGAVVIGGQQPPAAGVFTADQAAAGRQAYEAGCASCHGFDLRGLNEAPPLAGVNFMNEWQTRSPGELAQYIQAAMPPTGPRPSLEQSLSITAFILQSNGAQAGAHTCDGGPPARRWRGAADRPGYCAPGAALRRRRWQRQNT